MASPPTTLSTGAPNNTVYIRNLEESIKIPALKVALESIFSQYGNILEIVAKTNLKAKGQAFVVFDSVEAAQSAIREVQGFSLFEKPMVLQFARGRSDAWVRANSTEEEYEVHRRRRMAEKERKQAQELAESAAAVAKSQKRPHPAGVNAVGAGAGAGSAGAQDGRPAKTVKTGLKSTGVATVPTIPDEYLPPNKILFLQNLPADATKEILSGLFGRFDGFKEVRMVPGRKGIAFVEYEHQEGAISAKEALAGAPVGDQGVPVKVTYQRQ